MHFLSLSSTDLGQQRNVIVAKKWKKNLTTVSQIKLAALHSEEPMGDGHQHLGLVYGCSLKAWPQKRNCKTIKKFAAPPSPPKKGARDRFINLLLTISKFQCFFDNKSFFVDQQTFVECSFGPTEGSTKRV